MASPAPTAALAADNASFGLALLGLLAEGSRGNLFVSPYSISAALAMTQAGARRETALEMAKALRLSLPAESLHPAFQALADALRTATSTGCSLVTANRLWLEQSYPLDPAFAALTERCYGAGVEPVDFRGDPSAARQTINAWVSRVTQGKIGELIPAGIIDALTRLVLTNAIHFEGKWAHGFSPARTQADAFHREDGVTDHAPLMRREGSFAHALHRGIQILALPYVGGRLDMLVLLPPAGTTTTALIEALATEGPAALLDAPLQLRGVRVTLPRFRIGAAYDLVPLLRRLGMRRAFDAQLADFSGMSAAADLMLGHVLHEAQVDVDESGTVAAAATAAVMVPRGGPPPSLVEFRADRPFVFFIRDRATRSLLFAGRLATPATAST